MLLTLRRVGVVGFEETVISARKRTIFGRERLAGDVLGGISDVKAWGGSGPRRVRDQRKIAIKARADASGTSPVPFVTTIGTVFPPYSQSVVFAVFSRSWHIACS